MNTEDEYKEQRLRVADAENPGMAKVSMKEFYAQFEAATEPTISCGCYTRSKSFSQWLVEKLAESERQNAELRERISQYQGYETRAYSELKEERDKLTADIEGAKSARKRTQGWYARHYGTLQAWARTELPEPWVSQFFNCVANGTAHHTSSNYFRVDTAEGQLILDQTKRAEDAEARVNTLEAIIEGVIRSLRYGNVPYAVDLEKALAESPTTNHIAREKVLEAEIARLLALDGDRCKSHNFYLIRSAKLEDEVARNLLDIEALTARVRELEACKAEKLEQFFREVMAATFEGCDWDGDQLQDKAEELGLAHYEPYDPDKHDSHGCGIELGEPVLALNLPAQKEEGRPKIKRLEDAIAWALGEGDSDFGDNKPENAKPFWWRNELRKRARGDGSEQA